MVKGDFQRIIKSKKTYWLGAIVGTVAYLISWFINLLGWTPKPFRFGNIVTITGSLVDINLREQLVLGGVSNTLGTKMMQLLTAVPKFSFMEHITLVIGSIVLVIIGRWIYTLKWAWKGKPRFKLAIELFYGALAVTLLTAIKIKGGFGLAIGGLFNVVLTLAIYYTIIAFLTTWLSRTKLVGKVLKD